MTTQQHTKGPWRVEMGAALELIVADTPEGPLSVAEVLDDCHPDGPQQRANARIIAAAPDMLAELRETAEWLTERAKMLSLYVSHMPAGGPLSPAGKRRQILLDEAARIEGRAFLIRQTILKATQGA